MQPSPAPFPVDLQVAVPSSPSEHPDLENLFPPLDSHLAYALASLGDFHPPLDPFQGSALSGFGLPVVGTALATRPSGEQPADREIQCGFWSTMVGAIAPRKSERSG